MLYAGTVQQQRSGLAHDPHLAGDRIEVVERRCLSDQAPSMNSPVVNPACVSAVKVMISSCLHNGGTRHVRRPVRAEIVHCRTYVDRKRPEGGRAGPPRPVRSFCAARPEWLMCFHATIHAGHDDRLWTMARIGVYRLNQQGGC